MGSKMRMFYPYPKGRSFQNEDKVTFKALKKLKLEDRVIPEKRFKGYKCLPELGLFLTCLKENQFVEKDCLNELNDFNECSKRAFSTFKAEDDAHMDLEYSNYKPNFNVNEVNNMFKKYKK